MLRGVFFREPQENILSAHMLLYHDFILRCRPIIRSLFSLDRHLLLSPDRILRLSFFHSLSSLFESLLSGATIDIPIVDLDFDLGVRFRNFLFFFSMQRGRVKR